jgi:protease IV
MKNLTNWIKQILNLGVKTSIVTSSFLFTITFFLIATAILFSIIGLIFKPTNKDITIEELKLKHTKGSSRTNKLVVMKLNGTVVDPYQDSPAGLFQGPAINGYEVKKNILTLADKGETKALILDLNTYGGSPDSARLINEGIQYYKDKTKNPLIVYVDSAATSAGAMLSSNATKIYANQYALVANVGVAGGISFKYKNPMNLKLGEMAVDTKDGIEARQLFAGKYKRDADPFNPTPDEVENVSLGQNLINQVYNEFVAQMVKDRGIDEAILRNTVGAKALIAKDAKQYKFIDETLNREQAIEKTLEVAGIQNDYSIYDLEENITGLASLLKLSPFNTKPTLNYNFCFNSSPIAHLEPKEKLCP